LRKEDNSFLSNDSGMKNKETKLTINQLSKKPTEKLDGINEIE
jgi:hypothetical protein